MITKQMQLMAHESLNATILGTVWKSKAFPYGQEPGWVLIIRTNAAPTGTTPSAVWEVDASSDGITFTRIGGAIAGVTAAGALVVPYYTGTTQGAVPGGTLFLQVVCTLAAADNVFPDVTVDFVAMD